MSKQGIKCFTIKELYLSKIVKEVIKFDNGHNAMCITGILREIVVWFFAVIAKTARQGFSVILYLFLCNSLGFFLRSYSVSVILRYVSVFL